MLQAAERIRFTIILPSSSSSEPCSTDQCAFNLVFTPLEDLCKKLGWSKDICGCRKKRNCANLSWGFFYYLKALAHAPLTHITDAKNCSFLSLYCHTPVKVWVEDPDWDRYYYHKKTTTPPHHHHTTTTTPGPSWIFQSIRTKLKVRLLRLT